MFMNGELRNVPPSSRQKPVGETDPIVHISEIGALTVIKYILEKVNWHKYFTGPIVASLLKPQN